MVPLDWPPVPEFLHLPQQQQQIMIIIIIITTTKKKPPMAAPLIPAALSSAPELVEFWQVELVELQAFDGITLLRQYNFKKFNEKY